MCENRSRTTCPDSIACTQNQTSRVGVGCGAAHALRVQPTAPFPHAVKIRQPSRVGVGSLTLLLQNHLDHFNNLLLDLWYRKMHVHPCSRLTPVSDRLHDFHQDLDTGKSTICFPTRFCTRSRGTCCTPSKICSTGSGRSGAPGAPDQCIIRQRTHTDTSEQDIQEGPY